MKRTDALDLWLLLLADVAAVATLLSGVGGALQVAVALPLVLVLPGYALSCALLPGSDLGHPERIALSIGLSICQTILGGLLLNAMQFGLRPDVWAPALASTTAAATLVALWRRRRSVHRGTCQLAFPSPCGALMLLLAAGLVVAAFVVARTGALREEEAGFTQLWMLPYEADPSGVRVGLVSYMDAPTRYRLELRAGESTVVEWGPIELTPHASWEGIVLLADSTRRNGGIEAVVYDYDVPEAAAIGRVNLVW